MGGPILGNLRFLYIYMYVCICMYVCYIYINNIYKYIHIVKITLALPFQDASCRVIEFVKFSNWGGTYISGLCGLFSRSSTKNHPTESNIGIHWI